MSDFSSAQSNRFTRSSDQAILGGVCAGIANYFGFNLKATRFLAILAFLFAMPMAIIGYFAAVILIPAAPSKPRKRDVDPEFKKSLRQSPKQTMNDVRGRFKSLDRRLAKLEKYVTSSRYQLDQQFRDLEKR